MYLFFLYMYVAKTQQSNNLVVTERITLFKTFFGILNFGFKTTPPELDQYGFSKNRASIDSSLSLKLYFR